MKKIILAGAIIVIAFFVFFYERSNQSNAQSLENASIIFFYGKTCPHCKIVEDFIKENNVREKIKFEEAEIYFNRENARIFKEKNKVCGITDEKNMGVPFLWAEGKCYSGDQEVINYFKSKM